MNRTWMPTVAGILDIISGSVGIAWSCIMMAGGMAMRCMPRVPVMLPPLVMGMALPLLALAILAIIGGVYALQRKNWGLALAASIAAFFPSWVLGIPAIVLVSLSRDEFK